MDSQMKKFPPYNIFLDNYQYILKGGYSNVDCSYRCPHRKEYKIIIRVSYIEINEFITNKKEKIQYSITSTKKIHTCIKMNRIKIWI